MKKAINTFAILIFSISVSAQLFYTPEEISIWQERAKSGPYKSPGDAGANSPGDWERIEQNAEAFMKDPVEYYYGSLNPEPHSHYSGLKDAAFIHLVTGEKKYLPKIKQTMLKQVSIPEVDFSKWEYVSDLKAFALSDFVIRLLYAYDFVQDQFSSDEKEILNKWFYNAARYYADNVHHDLKMNFPERLNENYSVLDRDAKSGVWGGKYAYLDKNGTPHHKIPLLAHWYNNRRASQMMVPALVGVFLNDADLIHHTKIFVKEMLKYGTFPDGTMGEYERNGGWGNPQQGMVYSSTNIEFCVLAADALARKGDFELYDYTTAEGLWGTEGGEKSIKLLIDTYYRQVISQVERYYQEVKPENRIDLNSETRGTNWVTDILFAPANIYYKDPFFTSVYTRTHPDAPPYPDKNLGTAGPVRSPWGGSGAKCPGYLFMYGQMEGKVNPYPNKKIEKL